MKKARQILRFLLLLRGVSSLSISLSIEKSAQSTALLMITHARTHAHQTRSLRVVSLLLGWWGSWVAAAAVASLCDRCAIVCSMLLPPSLPLLPLSLSLALFDTPHNKCKSFFATNIHPPRHTTNRSRRRTTGRRSKRDPAAFLAAHSLTHSLARANDQQVDRSPAAAQSTQRLLAQRRRPRQSILMKMDNTQRGG